MKLSAMSQLARSGRRHGASTQSGFSLIELLVTILIIAIIAAIAIPRLGEASTAARIAKDKRNAQSIVSIYTAASAVGLSFADSGGDLDATIDNTISGGNVTEGIFVGEYFGVPGMDPNEKEGAKTYLEIQGEDLVYNEGGL